MDRSILKKTFLTLCAVIAGLQAMDLTKEKVAYIISDSHLDTYWQWQLSETINTYIPATIDGNMNLFSTYPKYVFSFEGSIRYQYMKQYSAASYAKLTGPTGYVAKGNWALAGGMVDASDVNIASPEALIHNILYANNFFQDEFGRRCLDVFLPDCFGFPASLPTIAAHCGLIGFSSQKFDLWGGWRPAPFSIGVWYGPDSSSIFAALKPGNYSEPQWKIRAENGDELKTACGIWATYNYFGVGDKGGANDPAAVKSLIERMNKNATEDIKVISASSDSLFKDLARLPLATQKKLPAFQGELIMQYHGTGTYTAHADVKQKYRIAEKLGLVAERAAVIAEWTAKSAYPRDALKTAWVRLLKHTEHDGVTGTSIPECYPPVIKDMDSCISEFSTVLSTANTAVAGRLATTVTSGVPVVVFNPLSFDRSDVVAAKVTFADGAPTVVSAFDANGKEAPAQLNAAKDSVFFLATVPSLGYAVFEIRKVAPAQPSTLTVSNDSLTNKRYTVKIDAKGDISQIYDKSLKRNLLSAPIQLQELENNSGIFPAWEILFKDLSKTPAVLNLGTPVKKIVENGAARVALEIKRNDESPSDIIQTIRLSADTTAAVEVETRIPDWQTGAVLLKASFPLASSNPLATYDLGLGTIERPSWSLTDSMRYEVPAQQWADISNADKSFGVSVLSDYKQGWDKPNTNTLRLSLIHSPSGTRYGYQGDLGLTHQFKYGIAGHTGDWKNGSVAAGQRFNHALVAFQTTAHAGALGKSLSLLRVDPAAASVMAVKKAERTNTYIVRVREVAGAAQNTALNFSTRVATCKDANGMEDEKGAVAPSGNSVPFALRPYQPKTFSLTLDSALAIRSFPGGAGIFGGRTLTVKGLGKGTGSVDFRLGNSERVLDIYLCGMDGRIVRSIVKGGLGKTADVVAWDGKDAQGKRLASGVYMMAVRTETRVHSAILGMVR